MTNKKILDEIDSVLTEYEEADKKPSLGLNEANTAKSMLLALLQAAIYRLSPPGASYTEMADKVSLNAPTALPSLRGILQAIRADYAADRLKTLQELVHSDLFADMLETSEYLLGESYKDPAAVMAGGVLEQHLRELCRKHGINPTLPTGNPFQHPTTGAKQRIASFVVANAGSIGDNARANFFTAATNAEHGGAVKMLDGKALLALDRWATAKRVEQVGEMLTGLLIEIRFNRKMIDVLLPRIRQCSEDADVPVPIERLRSVAASHYIQNPLLPSQIDTRLAEAYFHFLDCINRFLDFMGSFGTRETKMSMAQSSLEHLKAAIGTGNLLDEAITAALTSLGPLATA